MDVWKIPVGIDDSFTITINDSTGAPIAFTGSETLTTTVWPGQSLPALFFPTTTWVTPSAGTVQVTIAGSATAALSPSIYRARLTVVTGGQTDDAYEWQIELLPSPGSVALAQPAYITIDDVRDICPWIEELLQSERYDTAGFARQLLQARQYLDRIILRSWRGNYITPLLGNLTMLLNSYSGIGVIKSFAPNPWLINTLNQWTSAPNAVGVILTPELVQAMAHYAAAQILKRNVNRDKSYQRYALDHENEAYSRFSALVVGVDTNGDGVLDLAVALSQANIMYD